VKRQPAGYERRITMFVRVYRPREDKELLININSIWKIEVMYAAPNQSGGYTVVGLRTGMKNPEAVRCYEVFFGNERSWLISEPGDPVMKVFEEIYNNATKGPEELPDVEPSGHDG
jgi:hypothetical protein